MNNGVHPIAEIAITDTHNAFGFMDQAGFNGTDRLSDLGYTNSFENSFIKYDSIINALYSEPIFVPYHNLRTGNEAVIEGFLGDDPETVVEPNTTYTAETIRPGLPAYPVLQWDLNGKSQGTDFTSTVFAPLHYTGLKAQATPGQKRSTSLFFSTTTNLVSQGYTNIRGFYCFKKFCLGELSSEQQDIRFEFYISDTSFYKLEYVSGIGVTLSYYEDNEVTASRVIKTAQSFNENLEQELAKASDYFQFMPPIVNIDQTSATVLLIGGYLQVWLNGQTQPLVMPCNADYFTKVRVIGHRGNYVYFSVHPMSFAADSYMTSNERNAGFVPRTSTPVEYLYNGIKPTGTSVSLSTTFQQGMTFRYTLGITNTPAGSYYGVNYSHDTALVRSVTYRIAPYMIRRADAITNLPPREISLNIRFDPDNLNIYSTATVVCNNRHGEWRDGWPGTFGGKGNRAVTLDLGWEDKDLNYRLDKRFTGIGGLDKDYIRSAAPESVVKFTCEDLSHICRNYPLLNAPWMDGWCHLYAIRYLAWLSGITDDQMDFEYCGDPFCATPGHYHLPMGEGNRPLVSFPPETPAWAAMNRIRKHVGYIMYFNLFGKLNYYKWVRTSPGPWKRTFYEGKDVNLDPFQSIQTVTFSTSTRDVRTGVTVVGIDAYGPMWKPILAVRANNNALYNKYSSNYKGFRSPMAWADSMFANIDYANAAADSLSEVVSLPVERLSIGMMAMGDLYPLDVIGIVESKTPASDNGSPKAFFITQTNENWSIGVRSDYKMQIAGRWIV